MPLSEFLRMARGRVDYNQQRPYSTDVLSRPADDDLVELVWENGQVVMQGQSSRVARNLMHHRMPSDTPNISTITSRIGKFGSISTDVSPVVPSGDLDLGQDDEIIPWLNYHMDDPLQNYTDDFLPEISGITSFVPTDKKNSRQNGSSKSRLLSSWPPQKDPSIGSGVSDIISNSMHNYQNSAYGNSAQRRDSNSILNFSHFSKPASLMKSSVPTSVEIPTSVASGSEIKMKGSFYAESNPDQPRFTDKFITKHPAVSAVGSSRIPAPHESFPAEKNDNLCRDNSSKKDKPPIPGNCSADANKGVPDGERTVEPMVASSSVGSGNSVDRLSYEQTHNSKRKFRDIEDSECLGDDIETESADVKKPSSGRGGAGSKRSRAAEVHNLSERRRRDRINEKMRALQELIPNCNKADKASMLDEAIEYLKTLQLQVQIMSTGAGLCMPPMMFPTGMLPSHMPHFSPMGMGMGMGFGMGMMDMNGGSSGFPVLPGPSMHGAHFPSPMNFPRMPLGQVYGHPSPNSLPRAPLVPLSSKPTVTSSAMGLSGSRIGSHSEMPGTSVALNLENPVTSKISQIQATNEVPNQLGAVQENKQVIDIRVSAGLIPSTTATDMS